MIKRERGGVGKIKRKREREKGGGGEIMIKREGV